MEYNTIKIVNKRTGTARDLNFSRQDERIEFLLHNGAEEEKSLRVELLDQTVWVGVDGYGEPSCPDGTAMQVAVDVFHMDMQEGHEHYDEDAVPHPFVRVFERMGDEDPDLIWLGQLRLFTPEEALQRITEILRVVSDPDEAEAANAMIEDVLSRVRQ